MTTQNPFHESIFLHSTIRMEGGVDDLNGKIPKYLNFIAIFTKTFLNPPNKKKIPRLILFFFNTFSSQLDNFSLILCKQACELLEGKDNSLSLAG